MMIIHRKLQVYQRVIHFYYPIISNLRYYLGQYWDISWVYATTHWRLHLYTDIMGYHGILCNQQYPVRKHVD